MSNVVDLEQARYVREMERYFDWLRRENRCLMCEAPDCEYVDPTGMPGCARCVEEARA